MRQFLSIAILLSCLPCTAATKVFPLVNSFWSQPFLLQTITTNPWAAYSVTRRLSSTYGGSAFKVRRSSDATDLDIGFINGVITDTNALLSFVGSGTGYLIVLYDQSGHGIDLDKPVPVNGALTNASARVVLNGVLQIDALSHIAANFDNNITNSIFATLGPLTNLPVTLFLTVQPNSLQNNKCFGTMGACDWSSVGQAAIGMGDFGEITIFSGTKLSGGDICAGQPYLFTYYFENGTSDSIQLYTTSATVGDAGSRSITIPQLGASSSGGDFNSADFRFSEWIIYTNALSASDKLTLQQNITNFYAFGLSNLCANTLNSRIISYWKMDEASGTRADARDSNTLTDNNTVTSTTGIISNAGLFTAANSEYLTHVSNASLAVGDIDFTFSYWAMLTSKPAQGVAISKFDSLASGAEYLLDYVGGVTDRFRFTVSANGTTYVTVSANTLGAPATNTWYFIVQWHDKTANTINIQVNDGAVDSVSHSAGVLTGTSGFKLGAFLSTPAGFWDGRIDEVGYWKRILTSAERTALYNSGAGKTCCPFTP